MGQIVLELEKTGSWADFTADDLAHRYLWGPGANNLLVDEAVSDLFDADQNDLRWALADHLGTVRDWVDNSGAVLDHAEYDSFGRRLDAPAIDAAFGFTGALLDKDTGLQNHLHRWYDTETGSWVSQDPIGFVGGDANLYRYVAASQFFCKSPLSKHGGCYLVSNVT